MDSVSYRSSATTNHFQKITKIVYIVTATNFWFEDVELPSAFVKFNNSISKFVEVIVTAFVLTGSGALYNQENLSEKQNTDVILKSLSNFIVYFVYVCTLYHKEGVKELLFTLAVTLKEMFNDKKVECMMIRKSWLYLAGLMLVVGCPMIGFGVEGAVHTLTSNATFTTVITIWPDLEDRSLIAGVARVIIYIVWLLLSARMTSVYSIIITVSICLGHQFSNLYEYFLSLNDIFDGDESIEEQEQIYENAVRDGVKMHCITLDCVNQLQTTCHVAYSGQFVIIVCMISLLMIQMMQVERNLMEVAQIILMVIGVLVTTGLLIWSVGDITFKQVERNLMEVAQIILMVIGVLVTTGLLIWSVEDITFKAQRLPTAIFHSGWHNCRGKSSVRMRKTITIAMVEAQIVKASYSMFSVIY